MPESRKQATLFECGGVLQEDCSSAKCTTFPEREEPDPAVGCPVCNASMGMLTMELRIRHVEECLSMATVRETETNISTVAHVSSLRKQEPNASELAEISQVEFETSTEIIDLPEDSDRDEKQEIVINRKTKRRGSTQKDSLKRKREVGRPQKENLKYVHSQPTVKRTKKSILEKGKNDNGEPAELSELLPSSRKTEIPDLKILTFAVKDSTVYRISVDAFCYKPSDDILQYFLSHFHSDHYGGITKKWCRERTIDSKIIYCSVITGRLLSIRYSVEPCYMFSMENDVRYKIHCFEGKLENGGVNSKEKSPGIYVTCIDANHCPGAVIFLFEGIDMDRKSRFSLHCGDFRVNKQILHHPLLADFLIDGGNQLEKVYLDTTYMTPKYNFPKQEQVCDSVATFIHEFSNNNELVKDVFGSSLQSRITDFLTFGNRAKQKKYLILVGTYLIGKEKLAIAVLKRLGEAPIYVSKKNVHSSGDKEHIIRSYEDPYLDSVLTTDSVTTSNHDAMIHLVPMKIAGNIQELHKYFNHNAYHEHFERCIGLRPTGWSFKEASADNQDETAGASEAHAEEIVEFDEAEMSIQATASLLRKQPTYTHFDTLSQNLNKRNGKVDSTTFRIFSVPYSEHSSFRELSFFVVFFNIKHVIPTVNTSNPYSAQAMEEIIRRWETIRAVLLGERPDLLQRIQLAVKGLSLDDF